MKDLLNEKEFIQKPYNPWKLFYTFYVIAVIQFALFMALSLVFVNDAGVKSAMVALLLPDITALAMFFSKKKNATVPVKTIGKGIFILFAIYYVPAIAFSIYGRNPISFIAIIALLGLANFLLCFTIIYFMGIKKRFKA